MSRTWTIFSHPTPARLCRMTSRLALSESFNICQGNRMDAKDFSDKLRFTFKAHFRFVSRCQHVKTLPLIPTPKDSFETSYVSVIASRRVGNGNGRQFSGALVDLDKTNQINGLVSSGTKSVSGVHCTYVATITEKGVFPGALTFCCCFCCCCCSSVS